MSLRNVSEQDFSFLKYPESLSAQNSRRIMGKFGTQLMRRTNPTTQRGTDDGIKIALQKFASLKNCHYETKLRCSTESSDRGGWDHQVKKAQNHVQRIAGISYFILHGGTLKHTYRLYRCVCMEVIYLSDCAQNEVLGNGLFYIHIRSSM